MEFMEELLGREWFSVLQSEFPKRYFLALFEFLQTERSRARRVFPGRGEVFTAFKRTPFSKVKVVLIGQDPYHGFGQAHGLSFSVRRGTVVPPSLLNIYKELRQDLGVIPPSHGSLESWADKGVLLLNSVLTVVESRPASHRGKGWEIFTDAVISKLSQDREGLVFLLWGKYAMDKGQYICDKKHCVIRSAHPSPLSAHSGFFGSRPFSKANAFLEKSGSVPVDWSLPS